MENRRPYWQVAVSLLFSILATAAFIVYRDQTDRISDAVRDRMDRMPAIATPLVNWLEKRLKIVKKLGSALIVILVLAAIVLAQLFCASAVW